jgi:hypothetical protein
MPINSELCEESQIYDYLYDDIADAFKKEKLVPIKGSRYALADMIIIASDNSIVRLMKNKKWADISSSHALLRSFYANELGIQTVNFENFIELCTINYLKERKTSWLYQFYAYCSDRLNNDYRDINKNFLKQQSIIKSRTGNFVSAYVGESQNIFLNSKGLSNARIVDNIFTTKAKGVPQETRYKLENLLEKLEIKSRSPKSTIELDIMRKWEKSDFKMRKKLFFDIVDIYNVSNKDEKDEIAKYLSDKNVLYATSGEWFSDNVYQDTANLHLLFDSVNKVGYIHADFWVVDYKEREITQKDGVKKLVKECCGSNELLEALGVIKGLRVRREESGTYWRFYQPDDSVLLILKEYDVHKEVALSIDYTYEIDNFDEILKNIDTPKKSRALVDELLAISDDKYSGSVNWYSSYQAYKPKGKYVIPAQFILDLSKEKWIFDKDGRPKAPNEVFEEDFRELYEIKKAEKLPEWIDFKPSVVKSLPPDDQEKLKLVASYTPEQLKIILDSGDTVKDLENEPEISLEDRTRDIVLDENRDIEESEADSSHSEVLFNEEVHEFSVNKPAVRERKEKETTKKTDNSKKMLGDYAEGKVMELLKRDHPNATDIPGGFISVDKKFLLIGDNNPGYDIEVSKGDEIIEYIEVKSRTAESSSVVITYTEWEYAKKYAAKYTIYVVDVVSDISDEETPLHSHKYRDPYKQYKEGIISVIPDSYRLD